MKTEILPYQRIGEAAGNLGKQGGKKLLQDLLTRNNAILIPVAFLLGRASPVGGVMPFGMALYAATYGMSANRLLVAMSITLGMMTGSGMDQIYATIVGMLLFNAFNLPFRTTTSKSHIRYAVSAFTAVLLPQLLVAYLQGFLLFDVMKSLFNAFIVFTLFFIFRYFVTVLLDTGRKTLLTNEEMISVGIVTAIAISGFADIQAFGINVRNLLCILVILMLGYKCGAGVGAATGVTVGLIVSMSTASTPLIIGSYSFCGLLAGALKSLGKPGSCLGFVVGNAVLTFYLNGSTDVILYLKEILCAVVIFLLLPGKVVDMMTGVFTGNVANPMDKRGYSTRMKEITVDRLNRFSKAFKELSKTFSEISQTKVVTEKQDISSLFDRVADRVCKDCSLCMHCWDRNFYNTYQVMFKIIEKLDQKGRIEEKDIPAYFLERCERIEDFVNAANNLYELFKMDMAWKNKIGESRGLVSQQLDGLSTVISSLASEIDNDMNFKSDLEDNILKELNRLGIRAGDAVVYENKWGKYEISIFHKGCGGKRSCITTIEKAVSSAVGRKMVKESGDCFQKGKNGNCNLRLVEEEVFSVTTGVARVAKENGTVSGDQYTFLNAGDGKYITALSDGMGSGPKAATQSRATISLLEEFMESGFDKDTTIKLINSILVLKSGDDSFATIDMAMIDLYQGEAEFVKVGAVPTLIKRKERVETVKSASLPAGILSSIEVELIHKKLDSGDFVILMSDGVVDAFSHDPKDEELWEFIRTIDSTNPQEIADTVLGKAYEYCDGKPQDDMMVLTAKIWKKAS